MPADKTTRRRRKDEKRPGWEQVADDTDRLPVPGGWIYRTAKRGVGVSTCFVPGQAGSDPAQIRVISRAAGELKQKLEQLRKLLDQLSAARRLKGAPVRSTKVH